MLSNNAWKSLRTFTRLCYRPQARRYGQLTTHKGLPHVYSQPTQNPFINNSRIILFSRVRWFSDLPEHIEIKLPALSPTMETGSIKEWKLKEGEKLGEGDVLAEIETDKATMEFSCPDHITEGYLAKILAPEGTKDIKLGTHIGILVENQEDIAAFADYVLAPEDTPAALSADPGAPVLPSPPTEGHPVPTPAAAVETDGRLKVTPYARKLASERGVDLSSLTGSGPGGSIRARDVTHPIKTRAYTGPTTDTPPPSYTDIELSGMRRTIAKRLLESKQSIPHYYVQVDVTMDEVTRIRKELNASSPDLPKLSLNDFIIKAAATALQKAPECNSSFHELYIRQHHNVDISVAVATEGGLLTPIVFTADKKGLREINRDVATLAEKARAGTLQPQEYIGGTFTISNLGMYGVSTFSAIINPPQSCILAVSATQERVVPDEEGCYKTAKFMNVQMSCDHRVVDGAVGARWLQEFKRCMECPAAMLL